MSDEADSAPTHPPANTALAARYGSAREAFDHALVILAMNLPYWHVHQSGSHELYVEEETQCHKDGVGDGGVCGDLETVKTAFS